LLHPSGGTARVMGFQPWRRDRAFLEQITLVMGQRNQLMWDIPVVDSFDRNRVVYRLSRDAYRTRVDELTELLDLAPLLNKPVRTLSLGERMKCEVAAALLHHPRVLYLDEPTLGLDVTMQRRLRGFIGDYNKRTGATVLLTSHYMADVEALCPRVIVVHHGAILFDGALADLVARATAHKTLIVDVDDATVDLSQFGEVVARDGGRITLRVAKAETARITGAILAQITVSDLTVMDPPIDEVIDRIFTDS